MSVKAFFQQDANVALRWPDRDQLAAFVLMISDHRTDGYFYVFTLLNGREPRTHFLPAHDVDGAVEFLLALPRERDCYISSALRSERDGRKCAAMNATFTVLDADGREAIRKLIPHGSNIVIATGTPGHGAVGFWHTETTEPVANPLRKSAALDSGADLAAVDFGRGVRIFGEGFKNHKGGLGRPVTCQYLNTAGRQRSLSEIFGHLPAPPEPKHPGVRPKAVLLDAADPLTRFEAADYVSALTGVDARAGQHIRCPLPDHEDRSPSFYIYPGDGGFCCFGCGASGSIIDFGAKLYGIEPRGRGYHEIRRRLAADLLGAAEVAA